MINIPKPENTLCVTQPDGFLDNFSKEDVDRVMLNIEERSLRYPIPHEDIVLEKNKASELRSRGWIKLEGALSHKIDVIDSISRKLNHILDGGKLDFDSRMGRQMNEQVGDSLNQSQARDNSLFLSIPEPIYNVPEISEIMCDQAIVNVAKSFFECMPIVGGANLRKSFANDLDPDITTLWHVDPNSPYFFKAFVYLNDVNHFGEGPYTYAEGSVDNKPNDLLSKYRWTDKEIENYYGKDNITYLTAKKGDVLLSMTGGFHKGQKCMVKDREMLTIDYLCHPDSWYIKESMSIRVENFRNLKKENLPLVDALTVRR